MSERIHPARAVAPGRIILKELEARGWSQQDLASIMGRPEQVISEIIRAKKQITAETAHQLAQAFCTSPEFWMNLEMQYQLVQAKGQNDENEIERRSKLYHLAPMNELIKRGWIRVTKSTEELEQEYCRFFQVSSVDDPPKAAFRPRFSEDRGPEERAILAWVRRVEELASDQKIQPFSSDQLPGLLDRLLLLANLEADIEKIPELLIENGIHFVIVPHLPKTYLDGAALWMDNHPVIALSLRYDRIDAFWFTLLHELAHIYKNHRQSHVDQLFDSENRETNPEEAEANVLASQWLLSQDDLQEFIEGNRPRYSRASIQQFAAGQGRHPGIVVGQLMYRGELKYSHLREYLIKVRPILTGWEDVSSPS